MKIINFYNFLKQDWRNKKSSADFSTNQKLTNYKKLYDIKFGSSK